MTKIEHYQLKINNLPYNKNLSNLYANIAERERNTRRYKNEVRRKSLNYDL